MLLKVPFDKKRYFKMSQGQQVVIIHTRALFTKDHHYHMFLSNSAAPVTVVVLGAL